MLFSWDKEKLFLYIYKIGKLKVNLLFLLYIFFHYITIFFYSYIYICFFAYKKKRLSISFKISSIPNLFRFLIAYIFIICNCSLVNSIKQVILHHLQLQIVLEHSLKHRWRSKLLFHLVLLFCLDDLLDSSYYILLRIVLI